MTTTKDGDETPESQADRLVDAARAAADHSRETAELITALGAAQDRCDALRAEVDKLRGVLSNIEWCGVELHEDGLGYSCGCPDCGKGAPWRGTGKKEDHEPDCAIAAALYGEEVPA